MLYTRNAFLFRKFYKEKVAREQGRIELNYVGSLHPDKSRRETGFAKLIYGNREDLGKLLSTIALNVAADDQAIYELIQNADDCKSAFFSVSYNEDYLLCINNGNYFSDSDMSAIINVAGNYKDGEDIGTFGIGFKILHRLVGTDDGRDAIINDYAGPIIFSWNKFFQLNNFLNGDEIRVGFDEVKDSENAWLVKLLYTCFPTHLSEKIRLQDYDTQDVKFSENELSEMREFLKSSLQNINLTETNNLKSGSIFFLKLGKGKNKFLHDGIDKIKSGLSYSFKFLNSLQKIYINGEEIKAKAITDYSYSFPIDSEEFNDINPKNKKRDIKFTFAYYRDYKKADDLRNELAPNLYTFFSMDEERNGFSFLLHCNAFDMNNNRRHLQPNSQINEKLLPIIAKNITQYIDNLKENDRNLFLSLYANLLLSKEPKSKPHINNSFFKYFQNYILENIPTLISYTTSPENVKIKNSFLEISPSDFGCSEIEWFYWNNEKFDSVLISEARNSEKLNLEKWDIIDLIKYACQQNKVDKINDWVKKIEFETSQLFAEEKKLKETNKTQEVIRKAKPYYSLLSEINKNILKSNVEFIAQIKFFKFSDGNFYSLNEIFESENLVLNYGKTFDIRYEIQNFGFITSIINIDSINNKGIANYSNIKDLIQTNFSDLQLFQKISVKVKLNTLRKDQKHKLFVGLQEFEGVGSEKLRDLELFKNSQGNVYPLRNLLKGDLSVPNWLFHFKIHIAEYTPELDKYLLQEKEIYKEFIFSHWEEIAQNITDVKPFYEKVIYYFGLEENSPSFSNQNFVYLNSEDCFVPANNVFFNSKFSQITKYTDFQDAVFNLTDAQTPHKVILSFLDKAPFKVENANLFDYNINDNTPLSIDEIKTILTFCKSNNEHFFENCIIEKQQDDFLVTSNSEDVYQIRPTKEIRLFIKEILSTTFKVLPFELDENYKEEVGIIQGEKLYDLILDYADVDNYKEQLVEIIHYDEPKRKFLLQLSEIRLVSNQKYTKEDFENKILELACNTNVLSSEDDIQKFRNNIVIEADGQDLKLSEIPPFTDKIKIENCELSLAKILPDTYQNSDHLSNLINQFISNGINQERIENLFGIRTETNISDIFDIFSEQTETLENSEQLAFAILCNKHIKKIDLKIFKVLAKGGGEYDLTYDFYTKEFQFLGIDATLDDKYKDIKKLLEVLPYSITDENQILEEPYFIDDKFVCPDLVTENLSDEQKLSLVDFLFHQWDKKNKKTFIKNINWSKIGDAETKNILCFNPNISLYPKKYACESEVLPGYLTKWIGKEENKTTFLSDLGIWTESSVIVDLRKFLIGKAKELQNNRIAQEIRFNDDETMLFNTFEWLKENEIELATEEQFEIFKKVVEVINSNRDNNDLIIQEEYDFNLLEDNSKEWKETENYSIHLYEGKMPKTVKLDEIDDYIFYRCGEDDFSINDNIIYLNSNEDKKKILQKVASDDKNNFTFEELWTLFSESSRDTELAERDAEIQKLRSQLLQTTNAQLGAEFSDDISLNDQKEANREAKEIVKEKLESEGFLFTNGINDYSTINGVIKENEEFPLVVKSYKYTDAPLKLGANEWIHLMKPNSMFWVHFGNRKLGCLKLNELLRKQDKLTISFSTENLDKEDRLEKFAELLHYFGNVHFDFNSVKPSDYSVANNLSDYRFDERKTEEDLSGDDENLL